MLNELKQKTFNKFIPIDSRREGRLSYNQIEFKIADLNAELADIMNAKTPNQDDLFDSELIKDAIIFWNKIFLAIRRNDPNIIYFFIEKRQ